MLAGRCCIVLTGRIMLGNTDVAAIAAAASSALAMNPGGGGGGGGTLYIEPSCALAALAPARPGYESTFGLFPPTAPGVGVAAAVCAFSAACAHGDACCGDAGASPALPCAAFAAFAASALCAACAA